MPVPTADLLLAFRQAKFALTEERQSVGLDRIAQFERHIESHLGALSQVLEPGGGFSAVPLGEVWVTPKKVTYDVDAHPPDVVSIVESLRPQRLAEIHLRCHLQPTMEFAIAEVLWIWKYGGALDSLLPPECIANRIKRDRVGNVDRWGRRLFHFWKQRYRAFQDAGIAAAKQTLAERGQCAFATFDIRSYYDRIDPSFLLSANLIAKVLPRLPVAARSSYAADTRNLLVKYAEYQTAVEEMMQVPMQGRGIPIGALSSRLVANLALAPLDNRVRRRHGVRHYARWVDDIIVVTDDIEAQDGIAAVAQELLPMQAAGADGALLLNTDLLRRPNSLFEVNRNKARVYWRCV